MSLSPEEKTLVIEGVKLLIQGGIAVAPLIQKNLSTEDVTEIYEAAKEAFSESKAADIPEIPEVRKE